MKNLNKIDAVKIWESFWSNRLACHLFDADESDPKQIYYCLGEIAVILCESHEYAGQLMEKFDDMNAIQKASFLDACPVELWTNSRTKLQSIIYESHVDPILIAASLRMIFSLTKVDIKNYITIINHNSNVLNNSRYVDEMIKIYKLLELNLVKLKDKSVFEEL
jgi:hypothetical protein